MVALFLSGQVDLRTNRSGPFRLRRRGKRRKGFHYFDSVAVMTSREVVSMTSLVRAASRV